MPSLLKTPLNDLRKALLKLKPTGPDGFEGLLAVVLGKIAGQSFRLASAGLQLGKDGETAPTANHISFEGKLYTGEINKNEVLTKITMIIGGSTPPDVWVLGATTEANTQFLDPLFAATEKNGIATLVLDWPQTATVPPLAAACASAPDETVHFLKEHISDAIYVNKARAAIDAIRANPEYKVSATNIRLALREPTLGITIAKSANRKWLTEVFADRRLAKQSFGQVLAPAAPASMPLRPRTALGADVQKHICGKPSGTLVAVLGGDGCGKSWLFAQSWLNAEERPLTIIIPACDLKPTVAYGDIENYLVSKLIEQTGGSATDFKRKRWEKRFAQWKNAQDATAPTLVICIDGLNQQPELDWPRWIDAIARTAEQICGVLIITSRETYFRDRISTALMTQVETIRVPDWSPGELNEILSERTIDSRKVNASVLWSLRNPRILAAAFELLNNEQIQSFAELSVERLLFEHIRTSARDGNSAETPEQFVKRLSQHAQAIIDRTNEQDHEDRMVFDSADVLGAQYTLPSNLLAITAERYFHPLPEDPTLYTLSEDGLVLALGLSIIKALQRAERNEKDIADALDELLEPIGALDKTAEAVFAAMLVASIDDRCSLEIRKVLICGYLRLQNIGAGTYAAFASVSRNATNAAMEALFDLSTSPRYTPNKDWLLAALRDCRNKAKCWTAISQSISEWLRYYSLDPAIGAVSTKFKDAKEEASKEVGERRRQLDVRYNGLTASELDFLRVKMKRQDDLDPATLASNIFKLLAGMPLAGFSEAFVAWSVSYALNSSYQAPYNEFLGLIRYNRRDWAETKKCLHRDSRFLQDDNISRTGKWALVTILGAIGTQEDAEREAELVEHLTADQQKFQGWRLVETYCATDPCDPSSPSPENVAETIRRYEQIDIEEVSKGRLQTREGHFMRDARPCLARFSPSVAINAERRYSESVVSRSGSELKFGVFSLEEHAALLNQGTVSKLLEIAADLSAPAPIGAKLLGDDWVTSQYSLFIALPHLDGNAQLKALMALPPHGPPMLKLAEILRPAISAFLEQALCKALQSEDKAKQLSTLMFACHSGTEVSDRSAAIIERFTTNESSAVRAQAMEIIGRIGDRVLIENFARKGWTARALDPKENYFEVWHGSSLIIQAAQQKLIGDEESLERISPRLFGAAAAALGVSVGRRIAERISASIARALDVELPFRPPAVEQNVSSRSSHTPPLLSLVEPDENPGPEAFFRRLSESAEEFEAGQEQAWESYRSFEAALTSEQARLIVEDVGSNAVEVCVATAPELVESWASQVLSLPENKCRHVANLALWLAKHLSGRDPMRAEQLFERFSGSRPVVRVTVGLAEISLESVCVWSSAENEPMDRIRGRRLDEAATDFQLAQEVIAALICGRREFLDRYVHDRLQRSAPAETARSLMVIGFGEETSSADDILAQYALAKGFVGKAVEAARYAYDRNRWARHWFTRMCEASRPEDYWRFSVLFTKIVDARYDLWGHEIERAGDPAQRFEPSIRSAIEHRVRAWKEKREKALFGGKAQAEVYTIG